MDKILKDIKGLIKISNKRDFFIGLVPYLGFFYIGNIFSKHIRLMWEEVS